MSHTVTITKLPDEESDDYEYTFGGTHDHTCMVGKRCENESCQAMDHEEETERTAHGLDHWWNWDNDEWVVHDETDCALHHVFSHLTEEETFEGLTLGTYPVRVEWEDTWWLEVQDGPIPDRTNRSEPVLSGQDSGECEHGDHEACDGTTPGWECLCSCHTNRTNRSEETR